MNFKFLILFLTIIIIFYIYCYLIFPKDIEILQTTLNDFNFSLLYMRQPIIITDYLEEKEKLINSWFKYNFINQLNFDNDNDNNENDNNWKHNNHKYLFINTNNDCEIIIYKANLKKTIPEEDERIIAIKLEKYQSILLPYKWKYYIKNINDVNIWGINDIITSFLGYIF